MRVNFSKVAGFTTHDIYNNQNNSRYDLHKIGNRKLKVTAEIT